MNPAPPDSTASAVRAVLSDVYPLDEFYALRHAPLPAMERLDASELPEPYQTLLAHIGDMTSKLENFHRGKIHIHLLARRQTEDSYFREVLLFSEGSDKPVEFGAIKIMLDMFPEDARREILRERRPLGQILTASGVPFRSQPRAFLRMEPDAFIRNVLCLEETHFLYGRRNTLVDSAGRPLAEIVEILPPAAAPKRSASPIHSSPSPSFQA